MLAVVEAAISAATAPETFGASFGFAPALVNERLSRMVVGLHAAYATSAVVPPPTKADFGGGPGGSGGWNPGGGGGARMPEGGGGARIEAGGGMGV